LAKRNVTYSTTFIIARSEYEELKETLIAGVCGMQEFIDWKNSRDL